MDSPYKKPFANFMYLVRIYLKYASGWFVVVAISTLIAPIQAYIDVVVIRDAINAVSDGNTLQEIMGKIGVLLGIYIVTILIDNLIETYVGEKINVSITNRINKDIYVKVLHTDYQYFDKPEFYENYTWTLNSFYQQTFSAVQMIWRFLMVVLTLGTLITLMATINIPVILFVGGNVLLTTFLNMKNNKEIYAKNQESLPFQRKLSYIQRIFYIKDYALGLKATKVNQTFLKQYDQTSDQLTAVIQKHRTRITRYSFISNTINTTQQMLTLGYLCYCVMNNKLNLGELTALFYASATLKGHMDNFFQLLSQTQNLNLYTQKIRAFFEMKSEIEVKEGKLLAPPPQQALAVEADNLSFQYQEDAAFILNRVNVSIKAGQKVAIVGENGVGKSTLAKLLLRLYDPHSGVIRINGQDIKDYQVEQLRACIGVAFQDSVMYAMSVRENIGVYHTDLEEAAIQEIVRKLKITKILEKNNATLETPLTKEFDPDGIVLSGGERQIIALARVLVQPLGLLILDEASSSLDPLMEYELNKTILEETKDATVILIAHRLSTVRDADNIFVLADGSIKEQGNHNELMLAKGKYYEMFTKQAENYIKA